MNSLILVKNRGEQTFARPAPDYVNAVVLSANTPASVSVPTSGSFAIFSSDGDFYARADATASVPVGNVTDGTASELNPAVWSVAGLSTISLVSDMGRKITIAFYTN